MAETPNLPIKTDADSHRTAIMVMAIMFVVALVGGSAALTAFF